jgi:hypothetical protein
MKRLSIFTAALLVAASGCGRDFGSGVPTAENVRLEVPASAAQPLTASTSQALQGDHSSFYDLTRSVTAHMNGGVGLVLGLLKAITSFRPTSVHGDTAVWGPHTEDLSPNTWKLTVTEISPGTYSYTLEGKAKTASDSAYVTVLSGEHTPAVDAHGNPIEHYGSGHFLLDWDAAQTLPEHGSEVGQAAVTYSRMAAPAAEITINVDFTQIRNDAGNLVDASYRFLRRPGQGGEFQFSTDKDQVNTSTALEHLAIKSRWMSTGAGRSDVIASGGDLSSPATASECWDSAFTSQYMVTSWSSDPATNYGSEATGCAFPSAEYSNL